MSKQAQKPTAKECFGRNLLAWRERNHYTQDGIGVLLRVSQSYISKLEGGRQNPTLDAAEAIAKRLGLTLPKMLRNTAAKKSNTRKTK